MRRTDPQGTATTATTPRGTVPSVTAPTSRRRLPVLPETAAVLAAAAGRAREEPAGGAPALLEAACGYWDRRGLPTDTGHVAAAPGANALLLALTAALGGDVLVPRPCAAWWAPYARLLGRPVFHVPTPPESGGVPDPYALLETVRRVRAEGGDPRLLVLSVADDPTGTVAPPELLHETVEAAAGEGLHLVSDETWRDTLHDPHATVLLSPAEMLPERVTVVTDLAGALLPPAWPAAVARFPASAAGDGLHARVLDVLTALGARVAAPVAAAAGYVLGEPGPVTDRRSATVRLHARLAPPRTPPSSRRAPPPGPAGRPPPLRRPRPAAGRARRRGRRRRPGTGGPPHHPPRHARPGRPSLRRRPAVAARTARHRPPARRWHRRAARGMPHLPRPVGTATGAQRVGPPEVGLRRSPRRSAMEPLR